MVSSVMTSSSAGIATSWLTQKLGSAGLSTAAERLSNEPGKAKIAATSLVDAARTSLAANPNESDSDFAAALNQQIDQDVASGKLSKDDADKIKDWLGQEPETSDASTGTGTGTGTGDAASADGATGTEAEGTSGAGRPGGGGGGGGGSTEKTEVSRLTTVSGATKTTVITYSDASTATETATATKADEQKYDKNHVAKDDTQSADDDMAKLAKDYLSQTPPGTLVNKEA